MICSYCPSREGRSMGSLSDNELMDQLKTGDMDALKVIYERYRDMAEAAVRRVIPNISSSDAEALIHDIFVALIKAAPSFDISKRLKPWLYGIALNKAAGDKRRNWLHRNLLEKHHLEIEALGLHIINSPLKHADIRYDLIQAFKSLPKGQHDVMVLHAVEGFTGEEIAEILNINVKTVWTRLHRARKTLSVSMYSSNKAEHPKGGFL